MPAPGSTPSRRAVLAILAAALVFGALAYPSRWARLWCLREVHRGAELVGIGNATGALGGQILGHNYTRKPAWFDWIGGGLAAAGGFGPAVVASILAGRRVSGASRRTVCGRCGAVLSGLTEPRCPSCGEAF